MSKRGVITKHTYRKQIYSRYINVSFVLFTISFFLFIYLFTSDRWITNTDPRSFAAAAKKQPTPAPKKKTAKPCSQWCAGCGGFCADGENETCNALAADRCGEKPCYAAGPDGKSYLCTQVPAAKTVQETPATVSNASAGCVESSKCSCDPQPVCNTVLRDSYHSSCPEYCEAYKKNTPSTPAVTLTAAAKSGSDLLATHPSQNLVPGNTSSTPGVNTKRLNERCTGTKDDCGDDLACLATPYGYYCAVPGKTYQSLKNGERCDTVYQCSNVCSNGFYRNPAGDFYCGKPPATTTIAVTTTPQYPAKMGARCSQSKNECGDGLACITTPYGYYCGAPSAEYKKLKDGLKCGSVLECSNQCEKGFYRNTSGAFYCGKPTAPSGTTSGNNPTVTTTVQNTTTVTMPPRTITQQIPTKTVTSTVTVAKDVCSNSILDYAAVGDHGGDILPNSYMPGDLVIAKSVLPNVTVEKSSTLISKSAVPMYSCFSKEVANEGYILGMYDGGGFRDCAAQEAKNSVDCGHSEHQTGLAADLFVIDPEGVRHELTVNPKSKGYGDATLTKILNKADDCGLAHPITYDDPHFFAVAAVVDKKNMGSYNPIPRYESNMAQLNAIIRRQQAACQNK